VELEQRCRLDERANFRNPTRAYEQRGQSKHHAIKGGEILSAMAGAIADEQLMLQNNDSVATACTPPGRTSFAKVNIHTALACNCPRILVYYHL
jgi:hypothetical protein